MSNQNAATAPIGAPAGTVALPPSYVIYRRVWLLVEIAILALAIFLVFRWLTAGGGYQMFIDFFYWVNERRAEWASAVRFPRPFPQPQPQFR